MAREDGMEEDLLNAIKAVMGVPRPLMREKIWIRAASIIDDCLVWNAGTHEAEKQK